VERELQCKHEEEMVEWLKKKLVCFQKTRGGMVKKGDTAWASISVNTPFTLEELIHLIDILLVANMGQIWMRLLEL
jgi:hypothetical protein